MYLVKIFDWSLIEVIDANINIHLSCFQFLGYIQIKYSLNSILSIIILIFNWTLHSFLINDSLAENPQLVSLPDSIQDVSKLIQFLFSFWKKFNELIYFFFNSNLTQLSLAHHFLNFENLSFLFFRYKDQKVFLQLFIGDFAISSDLVSFTHWLHLEYHYGSGVFFSLFYIVLENDTVLKRVNFLGNLHVSLEVGRKLRQLIILLLEVVICMFLERLTQGVILI